LHYAFLNLSLDTWRASVSNFLGPDLSFAPSLLLYWVSKHFCQRYQSKWQLFFC